MMGGSLYFTHSRHTVWCKGLEENARCRAGADRAISLVEVAGSTTGFDSLCALGWPQICLWLVSLLSEFLPQ